jgi:hypothetical protein
MRWADEQQRRQRFVRPYMSAVLCLVVLSASSARADGAMDAWAQWALAPKVWKGQTVLAPDAVARPAGAFARRDSLRWPVHVHLPARSSQLQAAAALRAVEAAYDALHERAWPLPPPDGGYGGTPGFDLYLARDECGACARIDAPIAWSDFDAAQTYAVVDSAVPDSALLACAQSAVTQAGLRSVDPSEAESWAKASGELMAWLVTGEAGCQDSLIEAQRAAATGLLDADPQSGGAGALLLAMLTERIDGGSGEFVRGLWETTRQRSRGLVPNDRLRSSPDLWEALIQTLRSKGVRWSDELTEFGVARYFAGEARRRAQAPYRVLGALPSEAAVPLTSELSLSDLPRHIRNDAGVSSLSSEYVRVRTSGSSGSELRVWLKGELGPLWSLSALRLAKDGSELGRTSAPPRRVPNSYMPLALDPETAEVVLVITNLPEIAPDADRASPSPHAYELVVAIGQP